MRPASGLDAAGELAAGWHYSSPRTFVVMISHLMKKPKKFPGRRRHASAALTALSALDIHKVRKDVSRCKISLSDQL